MVYRKVARIGLLMALSFSAAWAETIEIQAFEYPPYYVNAEIDGGLSCEIVMEAFRAAGIDSNIEFFPVRRMIERATSESIVCSIGGEILFEELVRRDAVTLSKPIQYVVQSFMYDTRRFPRGIDYANLRDMSAYRIGVLDGSGIMRFLQGTPGLRLITNTIHDGLAKQLESGRFDTWAVTDLTGMMYIKKYFPDEAKYYAFTKAYNLGDISVAFNRENGKADYYQRKFTEGLEAIKKNGTYMGLMAKYYGSVEAINPAALADDMR